MYCAIHEFFEEPGYIRDGRELVFMSKNKKGEDRNVLFKMWKYLRR